MSDLPSRAVSVAVISICISIAVAGTDSDVLPDPTITLNNGVGMPRAALGTGGYSSDQAANAIPAALAVGFAHIDTAHDYKNQDGVSRGIAMSNKSRADLFITSKIPGCGVPTQGIPSRLHCYADSMKAFGEDLQLLNTTYIDLLLIHFPPLGAVLEEVYKSKQVRAIGVSNYCQECLECILKNSTITPAVNQVMHHVGMGPDPLKIRDFCAQHGIIVEAYSPLGSGSKELISGNLTTEIGQKYNKSSPEVAIKWIVQQGLPLATKASNPVYLREDIDMWSWNLTAADMQTLDTATKPFGAPSFMCV